MAKKIVRINLTNMTAFTRTSGLWMSNKGEIVVLGVLASVTKCSYNEMMTVKIKSIIDPVITAEFNISQYNLDLLMRASELTLGGTFIIHHDGQLEYVVTDVTDIPDGFRLISWQNVAGATITMPKK